MNSTFHLRFRITPRCTRLQQGVLLGLVIVNLTLGGITWEKDKILKMQLNRQEVILQEEQRAHIRQLESTTRKSNPTFTQVRQPVPWESLLDMLARLTPKNLQVIDITPDPESKTMDWTVQGKDIEAVTPYMRALNASGVLRNVYLVAQEAIEADNTTKGGGNSQSSWTFVLRGEWITAKRKADENANSLDVSQ